MIGLVLQRLSEQTLALEHDLVAVEIDAVTVACGCRSASCHSPGTDRHPSPTGSGSPETSTQDRVEDVADVAVDVVTEGAQAHADLRGRHTRAARELDGIDEVAHERSALRRRFR